MDHSHSTAFAAHYLQPTSFDPEKVDYGFDSMLGHDTCLTHGLDSLGTCNNTENACLDQRCFDHYGKTSAAKNVLEIGLDLKAGTDKASHRNEQANNPRPSRAKTRSQSSISASPVKMSAAATRASAHRQKRKRQSEQLQNHQHQQNQHQHQMDYHQTSNIHQHSPHFLHGQNLQQHIEPTAALQTVNENLHHNFQMPFLNGHHPSFGGDLQQHGGVFAHPSPYGRWPQAVAPSWANMMNQATIANCMQMSWPTHTGCNEAASADCTSACGDNKCWSQCGDGDDPDCCFDTSCTEIDFSQAPCCFEPTCAALKPCLDSSCQEAAIPCNDLHCVGTTVSTTPASVSVTTPSAEPEPMVNAILSPEEPSRDVSFDIGSAIAQNFGFAHDLGHSFTDDLNHHDANLNSDHNGSGLNQNAVFSMSSHSPTPKTELPDNQSMNDETDFTCRWLCEDGILCSKTFGGNKELQDHCKSEHVKNLKKGEYGFCCTWYGCIRPGPFSQKSKLERHMQTHTGSTPIDKPVKCDICGIMLSAKQSLEQHMRTHSGEKPWKCEHEGCGARFKQQSALTMHMRTHTGEKPLMCEICGKRFGESSNLSKHRRTHNVRGSHVCEHCGKDFHRLDQLRRHLQTHLPDGSRKSSKSS
ncbi:hypothetical protein HYE67_008995 [Fusarium culmorum]|uniref:C2H2 type master regulator of conidiophore development brlA n=1 Tax=Fusarium culmorum TaxID=5516 RepID=A0A2T4H8Z6_FUSCU|nr:Zinc-responsive transcriptional regulator ZAP1 [Fusarium culmorum]QPC66764.1 hypothetical protein HYE67_008995 [Fusarium culmorum]